MDPNSQFTPPIDHIPTFPRTPQPVQPIPPVKKNKHLLKYVIVGLLILLIAGGIGVYLWLSGSAKNQKNADDTTKSNQSDKTTTPNNNVLSNLIRSDAAVKSRSTKARANAEMAKSVAEIINVENGYFPRTTTDFIPGKLPEGITPSLSDPTEKNGLTTFRWEYTGPPTAPTGGRITYWDFTTSAISANVVYVGIAKSDSKFITPEL
jgi:hypothetical protein